MAKPKTEVPTESTVDPKIDIVDVVVEEKVETPDSPQKLAYLDMMIAYKKQNPVKYAGKEAGFLKKLAEL